nr:metallophosphoesterase family protein [Leisingera sp. ANG-M7]
MLSSLFQKFTRREPFAAPQPEEPLCVIGDVHGCFPQLIKLLEKVPPGHRCVLVGDYIDRGEQSAEVLRHLSGREDLTCLMGNHEAMLLEFLEEPAREGGRWLRNGGLQTLASFGIRGVRPLMNGTELEDCRDRLLAAMGAELTGWLAQLRTSVLSGNVLITHAGADPEKPADQQEDAVLIWGHPAFLRRRRRDSVWVVHGHTIVSRPAAEDGRIAIDTGAFAGGPLSAVCLDGTAAAFLEARP